MTRTPGRAAAYPSVDRMASKHFTAQSPEYEMMRDFWKIMQDFEEPEDTEAYWADLCEAVCAFIDKHDGVPLANYLLKAFVTCQEDRAKRPAAQG